MKRRGGYTLIELLVVMSILGIASTIGFNIYFRVQELWSEAQVRAELENKALNIFDALRRDLGQLLPPKRSGVRLTGTDASADDARFLRVPLASDTLTLPVALPDARTGYTGYAQVEYGVRREGWPTLERRVSALGQSGEPAVQEVGEGVFDFNVRYYAEGEWRDAWAENRAPQRLRISLTLGEPNFPALQIAREMTFVLPY